MLLISTQGSGDPVPGRRRPAAADGPGDLGRDRDEVPRRGRAAVDVGHPGGDGEDDRFVFTVTDGGFAKRTRVSEYRQQGRGGLGIKAMKLNEDRGSLVGGLVVTDNDEVIAIKASGQITRSAVAEVPVKGRDTMGVKFVGVGDSDSVVVIALNPETTAEAAELAEETAAGDDSNSTSSVAEENSSLGSVATDDDPRPRAGS